MASLTLRLNANALEGNEVSSSVPFRVHVHERVERFKLTQSYKNTEVPVAYLENEHLTPQRNIDVVSRFYMAPSFVKYRRRDLFSDAIEFTGVSYTTKHKKILATNIQGQNQKGNFVPLFFKHVLPTGTTRVEIRKVSNEEEAKQNSEFLFSEASGALYNNFINRFNEKTTRYTAYFVDAYGTWGKVTQILNNVPAVEEATWEDIDPETGDIYTDRAVYTVESNSDGFTYYFSSGGTYWIKPHSENIIAPVKPENFTHKEPWLMSFTTGEVVENDGGVIRRYAVPEAERQSFSPYRPYMYASQLVGMMISETILFAGKQNLAISPTSNRHLNVFLYDYEGNLKRILTTKASLHGTRFSRDVKYEYGSISSWSNKSGLVHFAENIPASFNVEVQTYYIGDDYRYMAYDLNPFTNKEFVNQRVVFYVIPDVTAEENAIQHIVVDAEDTIVSCSQRDSISYSSLALRDDEGGFNPNTVCGMKYATGPESFVLTYGYGNENDYGYLILCEAAFKDTQEVRDVKHIDLLVKGGMPIKAEEVYLHNRKLIESAMSWDERGRKVVKAGALVVEYPITLLKEYGGSLTLEQTEELLSKGLHVSVIPVFLPTYPKTKVQVNTLTAEEVSFECSWEGPYLTYKLYALSGDVWTELDNFDTDETRAPITFVNSGLTSGASITYKVTTAKQEVEFPESILVTVEVK